jgi:hypothetical protein
MTSRPAKIADTLLAAATEQHLVEMLFDRCENVGRQVGSVISESAAMKFYKGPLDKVIAIAADPGTSPRVLQRFAKDTRVSVRQAVLSNPSTPYATMLGLAPFVMERMDRHELQRLVFRLDAADLIDAMQSISLRARENTHFDAASSTFPTVEIAAKLVSGDRELLLKAIALGIPALNTTLALEAYNGNIPLTLTEVMNGTPGRHWNKVISRVATDGRFLTCEFAELVAQLDPIVSATSFTMVEEGALEILVRHHNATLFATAVRLGVPATELTGVIAAIDYRRLGQLLDAANGMVPGRLNTDQEIMLTERFVAMYSSSGSTAPAALCASLLQLLTRPLPRPLLRRFLGVSPIETTSLWLSGNHPEQPQRGEVLALIRQRDLERTGVYREPAWRPLVHQLVDSVGKAWEDDVAELLDVDLAKFDDVALAKFSTARIAARIGADPSAWDTLLGLAQDWDLGLAALLDATVALHPEAVPTPELVTEPEQQTLFAL